MLTTFSYRDILYELSKKLDMTGEKMFHLRLITPGYVTSSSNNRNKRMKVLSELSPMRHKKHENTSFLGVVEKFSVFKHLFFVSLSFLFVNTSKQKLLMQNF